MTSFLVGAYASLPSPEHHDDYYRLLAHEPWISGIEIPYPGVLADPDNRLAQQIAPQWSDNSVTAIPGTMVHCHEDPAFGLASPDSEGRQRALHFIRALVDAVARVNDTYSRLAIRRIQVHSAPSQRAQRDAFRASLDELLSWPLNGVTFVVEHCDCASSEHPVEKGFLSFEEERAICHEFEVGMHINWGRSLLDTRNPDTPLEQIIAAREEGVLAGVMFSGISPEETQYGYAWIDGHVPSSAYEPTSLMTPQRIRACADAAIRSDAPGTPAQYLGAKICVPAEASLEERIAMLKAIYEDAVG